VKTDLKPSFFVKLLVPCFIVGSVIFLSIGPISGKGAEKETILKDEQERTKYQYVGAEKCAATCHNNEKMGFQYNVWARSPHSQAYIILASKKAGRYSKTIYLEGNPQESLVCLKCHVTGGDSDLSFLTVTYRKEDGVTCEACHKGAYITKTYIPGEEDCLKCHNGSVHKTRRFNYRESCRRITHPKLKS
jgi:hypothetical protein